MGKVDTSPEAIREAIRLWSLGGPANDLVVILSAVADEVENLQMGNNALLAHIKTLKFEIATLKRFINPTLDHLEKLGNQPNLQ
jgi:hypothetical protein